MNFFLELLALLGLLLLNAFFVAAEYGLVTSRRTRIMELEHEGNRRARAVLRITSDPPRFISAMQLGVTMTSLAIGALGEQVLAHRFDAFMASFLAVILAVGYLFYGVGKLRSFLTDRLAARALSTVDDRTITRGTVGVESP